MTRNQLAVVMLICTRCIIDVVVECSDATCLGMSGVKRIADTKDAIDDYIALVEVDDVEGLRKALGVDG